MKTVDLGDAFLFDVRVGDAARRIREDHLRSPRDAGPGRCGRSEACDPPRAASLLLLRRARRGAAGGRGPHHDRQRQRGRRGLQRRDARHAGRRQFGHDGRPAEAQRLPEGGRPLGGPDRQRRRDPHQGHLRAPRLHGHDRQRWAPRAPRPACEDFTNAPLPRTWYVVALANKHRRPRPRPDVDRPHPGAVQLERRHDRLPRGQPVVLRPRQPAWRPARPRVGAAARVRARPRFSDARRPRRPARSSGAIRTCSRRTSSTRPPARTGTR